MKISTTKMNEIMKSESGKVGYLIAWLMGVPASLLLIIFLLRGH